MSENNTTISYNNKKKQVSLSKVIIFMYLGGTFILDNGSLLLRIIKLIMLLYTFFFIVHKKKLIKSYYFLWIALYLTYFCLSILWADSKTYALSGINTLLINEVCVLSLFLILFDKFSYHVDTIILLIYCPIIKFIVLFFNYGSVILSGIRATNLIDASFYNSLGTCSGIAVTLAVSLIKSKQFRKSSKNWVLISIILNSIICLLTGSRKGILFLVIPLSIFELTIQKNSFRVLKKIVLVFIAGLIIYELLIRVYSLYNLIGAQLQSAIRSVLGIGGTVIDSSYSGRLFRINNGITWFKEKPIFGHGIMNYNYLLSKIVPNTLMLVADNNIIDLLVNGGIVGTLLYYSLYFYIIVMALKYRKYLNLFTKGLVAAFISIFICEYGISSYLTPFLQIYIMLTFLFLSKDIKTFQLRKSIEKSEG